MVDLVQAGLLTIVVGVAVVLLAALLSTGSRKREAGEDGRAEVRGGGVVLIGPVPIIFGSDAKWASVAAALAVVMILVSLLLILWGR